MTQMETVDVLIAGSGPAGMSAALHLVKADPGWADRIVIVEKSVHPREKLCGGGVTNLGEKMLSGLGLSFAPAPSDHTGSSYAVSAPQICAPGWA